MSAIVWAGPGREEFVSARVYCPSCKQPCQVAAEHIGKAIRCPGCKKPFAVRAPAPVLPPAPVVARGPRLVAGCATSPGRVRERNEDSHLLQQLSWATRSGSHEALLAVVADGMGGHEAGDRASAVAIGAIAAALFPRLGGLLSGSEPFEDGEAILDALDHSLWEANRAVADASESEPGCEGMGSTAVAALIVDGLAAICHVGDCRAYLCREERLEQMTRDHTLVNRMIDLGTLSEKEADTHPAASQVTQALGRQYELEPSRRLIELKEGDRLVLACDGLHAHLSVEELTDLITADCEPDDLAFALVARADSAGGSDNCTVAVVFLESGER